MFKNLTDFSFKRSLLQACGFYLAYLLLGIILGGIIGGLAGALFVKENTFQAGYEIGSRFGLFVAIAYSVGVGFLVLIRKRLLGNFLFLILALLGGILALVGGGFLGLIPAAFLTTRGKGK